MRPHPSDGLRAPHDLMRVAHAAAWTRRPAAIAVHTAAAVDQEADGAFQDQYAAQGGPAVTIGTPVKYGKFLIHRIVPFSVILPAQRRSAGLGQVPEYWS